MNKNYNENYVCNKCTFLCNHSTHLQVHTTFTHVEYGVYALCLTSSHAISQFTRAKFIFQLTVYALECNHMC